MSSPYMDFELQQQKVRAMAMDHGPVTSRLRTLKKLRKKQRRGAAAHLVGMRYTSVYYYSSYIILCTCRSVILKGTVGDCIILK
jgi:hypothetical protein